MIRVLALLPYPVGHAPGQRYRIEQWAPLIKNAGVEITFSPFLSRRGMEMLYESGHLGAKIQGTVRGYVGRLVEIATFRSFDVVFLYREAALLGTAWLERLFSLRRPLVFDFDDAIYLTDTSPANAWVRWLKAAGKTAKTCQLARHVTVGNEFLARFASYHARRVTVVPSTIDTNVYEARPRAPNRTPLVGWTGSATTVPHLMTLAPALRRLRRIVDFELLVVGPRVRIEGVSVRSIPWRARTEPEDLRAMDVGVMPLPDDEWSRGKCGMKALQYMALGIPPVVSPVGANASIVQDGISGLHARTDDEWVASLALLLRDESLRQRLGKEARSTIELSYSARAHAPRMAEILSDAAQ